MVNPIKMGKNLAFGMGAVGTVGYGIIYLGSKISTHPLVRYPASGFVCGAVAFAVGHVVNQIFTKFVSEKNLTKNEKHAYSVQLGGSFGLLAQAITTASLNGGVALNPLLAVSLIGTYVVALSSLGLIKYFG